MTARRARAKSDRADPTASSLSGGAGPALTHLRRADPKLGRAIDVIGDFTLGRDLREAKSVYAALAEAIVSQQLSGKAAATIYGRVCALFPGGRGGPRPEQILAASDAELRGAGLSGAKSRALRDLAEKSLAGEIPTLARARRLEDEARALGHTSLKLDTNENLPEAIALYRADGWQETEPYTSFPATHWFAKSL